MEPPSTTTLRVGDWCVNPKTGQISRGEETIRLDERTMLLLLCLAERAGEVVSIDDLLNRVWPGVSVSQDSVYQAVATLRRQLGDNPKQPAYIATAPRLGYRLVAPVTPWAETPPSPAESRENAKPLQTVNALPTPASQLRAGFLWTAGAVLCLALIGVLVFRGNAANNKPAPVAPAAPVSQKSIAVLPFLDLTEKMNEEPFADGMTEELTDKLSKIPGLHVPAPRASFYFKGKKMPLAEIAKSLGVNYVLDGSVRKSGGRIRVSVRLVRADNGYVVWSETYDRPMDDILMVQDDIAGEVTKALQASVA